MYRMKCLICDWYILALTIVKQIIACSLLAMYLSVCLMYSYTSNKIRHTIGLLLQYAVSCWSSNVGLLHTTKVLT